MGVEIDKELERVRGRELEKEQGQYTWVPNNSAVLAFSPWIGLSAFLVIGL